MLEAESDSVTATSTSGLWFPHFPESASLVTMIVGGLVLVGWVSDVAVLKSVVPGLATMKFNTALCFVFAGGALWSLRRTPGKTGDRVAARICAAAVLALAVTSLWEYVFSANVGIDEAIVRDRASDPSTGPPGRMSAATAFGFVLLGLAQLMLTSDRLTSVVWSQALSVPVILCGLIGLEGYIYGTQALYSFFLFSSMAIHTAALFVVMGIGTLWARPRSGFVAVFADPHVGGRLIRPLLLPFGVLFVATGWLTLRGQRMGHYDAAVGVALFATVSFLIVAWVAWWLAGRLNQLHEQFEAQHARLRESTRELEDLRTALNEHAIVAFTDPDGRLTSVNPQFCAISGYTREELLGADHRIIKSGYHSNAFFADLWDTIGRGQVWHGEVRNRAKDGRSYWLAITIVPFFDAARRLTQYIEVGTDITPRKELEAALRAGEERFRALVESLPQLLWTCTGDGRCDYLSPQWVAYTGIPAVQQLGDAWLEQLHPDDRDAVRHEWNAVVPTGRAFDVQFRIRRHDGAYRWFKTRATPLRDATGSVSKWFGSNTDIQDLRDAEDALRQVNRDLEARVAERTRDLAAATAAAQSAATELGVAERIAQMGSWQMDVASGRVQWSEQMYRIVGLAPANSPPPEHEHARLFAADSWRRIVETAQSALPTGNGYEIDVELERPDGERRLCIARTEAVRDEEGRVVRLRGTLQDVTELKTVQQALEQATERMQLATAAARIGVWDWNVRENRLTWDATMCQLYGIQPEEFSGTYEAWQGLVHPDDLPGAETILEAALAGHGQFDTAFRIVRRPSGTIRHLRGAAVVYRDQDGRPQRMVGVNWDVTERREAAQALLASERLLREFVAHAPAAIAMLDREMRYLQASERWLQDYKLTGQDIIGRSHYEVFPDLPERWKAVHQRALHGAVERCDEEAFPRGDGSVEWLQWEVRPWLTPTGDIGGVLFFTQVITARKQMELDLQQRTRALERSNAELEQFAYVASHDLQEPLRAVAGCSQILERRYAGALDPGADELIRHIVDGAERMHTLIRDLLAYSRVDRQRLDLAPTDSGAALSRALTNLRTAIRETGAAITQDQMPTLPADPAQLAQLFQNLVGNALKYRRSEPPRIHIGARRCGDAWEFSVRDNGIGIEPQYFERIFVLFQRLHTRTEYPGTGIGLAICKKIVARHGGRIWAESTPGQGSVFSFSIPAASPQPS